MPQALPLHGAWSVLGDGSSKQVLNAALVAKQQGLCNDEADARLALWQAFFAFEVCCNCVHHMMHHAPAIEKV